MTAPTIRLHLLPARAAPRILIIRRGPTRVRHLLLWDTEHDTFEHGSWFRGALYARRCDLSFDGQRLVYFAMGPTREFYSWVAIARPPWLRAEILWPKQDTWRGAVSGLARSDSGSTCRPAPSRARATHRQDSWAEILAVLRS
jgi:hypothetical protein